MGPPGVPPNWLNLNGGAAGSRQIQLTLAVPLLIAAVPRPGIMVSMRILLLAAAAALALLHAQTEAPGAVVVRLTDATSRQPIADAKVTLFQRTLPRPRFFSGVTNASGDCRIENVAPGSYMVTVQKLGYVYWSRQLQVTVTPGATAEVKTSLEPTASASGVVRGEDNEPLAGVSVYAMPKDGQALHGESGADGRYRIDNIPPGPVQFRLMVPSAKMTSALRIDKATGERWTYPAASFHPGGLESLSQASAVTLAPGMALAEFDLQLRRVRFAELKGRVIDQVSRQPITAAEVELQRVGMPGTTDEAFSRRAVAGPAAEFRFPFVRPGSYQLLIFRDDRSRTLPFMTTVEIGPSGLTDHLVRVPPFGKVVGRLKTKKPESLAGAKISLHGGGGELAEAVVADGSFTIEDVPPGTASLRTSFKDPRLFVRQVNAGGTQAENIGFGHRFVVPEAGLEIELEISDEAGSVTGTVLDDKDNPVPNASVRIAGAPLMFPTLTDQFGRFRMEGVPPGKHKLFACAAREVPVEVKDGATASVALRDCPRP